MPDKILRVVPELPQSIAVLGERKILRPVSEFFVPLETKIRVLETRIGTPKLLNARRVETQSPDKSGRSILEGWAESAERKIARWVMDLSEGGLKTPDILFFESDKELISTGFKFFDTPVSRFIFLVLEFGRICRR